IHWVDAAHSACATVRLYDRLFDVEAPDLADCDYLEHIRADSLEIIEGARIEESLLTASAGDRFQFLRIGYFCMDSKDSFEGRPVFNRAVSLRDSYRPG
ncbi:MAG: glutamine--tRNA ligase, partial [Clostridiales bacterium]|nr:glutamine--tRNA ligase [Clostridiales bacterium]